MPSARSTTLRKQPGSSSPRTWVPDGYQRLALRWLVTHPEALLFLQPGLGKTTVAAAAFQAVMRAVKAKGRRTKALVLAPRRVARLVWTHDEGGEFAEYPATFGDLRVILLHGEEKDNAVLGDADLYVINPDGLKWLCGCRACGHAHPRGSCRIKNGKTKKPCGCPKNVGTPVTELLDGGVDTLIVDELSKFKHHTSARFKLLKPYLPRFKRRWGMGGSPVPNGLLDLFGQVLLVDLGQRLGTYVTHFRQRFFMQTGYQGRVWVPQEGAKEAIYALLADIALSMKAEDHIELPKLMEQNLWVDLPPKARKAYDELEEELITMLDEGTVTAANAAVASAKCRQVASGGLYLDEEVQAPTEEEVEDFRAVVPTVRRRVVHVHDEKTEALTDLVEELQGEPLLVLYQFNHDRDRVLKALGEVPVIGGGTSDKTAAEIVRAWNRREVPVLLAHPASMGHGLNLQTGGHHLCWYSPTWDYELYDQAVRRLYRRGQRETVFVHRLLARKTVDEAVLKALMAKRRGQDGLITALRDLHKRRRS